MTNWCGFGSWPRDAAEFDVADITAADSTGPHGHDGIPRVGFLGVSLVDTNVIGAVNANLLHAPMSDVRPPASN